MRVTRNPRLRVSRQAAPNPVEEDDPIEEFSSDSDDEFMYVNVYPGEPTVKYTPRFTGEINSLPHFSNKMEVALYAGGQPQWWETRVPAINKTVFDLAKFLVSFDNGPLKAGHVCINRTCQLTGRRMARGVRDRCSRFPPRSVHMPYPPHPEGKELINYALAVFLMIFSFFIHSFPHGSPRRRFLERCVTQQSQYLREQGYPYLAFDMELVAAMKRGGHQHCLLAAVGDVVE